MKASLGNSRQTGGDFQSRSCRQTGRDGWWVAKSDLKFTTGGKASNKMWMVWGKQIAEIYWLMDHLFFSWRLRSNYGEQWLSWIRGWITEEMILTEWSWGTFGWIGYIRVQTYILRCSVKTRWLKKSPDGTWPKPKSHKRKVNLSCKRDDKKKTDKLQSEGLGFKRETINQTKKKRKNQRRSESETIWIKDGREISIVWINEQIYHRCSGDWAAWGSGRLAKVVRGSREGGGRRLRWRRGRRGVRTVSRWRQAGSFLCDGKQEEGKRARQREVIPGRKPLRCSCLECPQRT